MHLEIFDKNTRKRISLIRTYTFAQYTLEFANEGKFKIRIPILEESISFLKEGNYIMFEKDAFGIIKKISTVQDDKTELTISGCMLNGILSYRSFLLTTVFYDELQNIQREMVNSLFINPEDERRKIDFIKLSEDHTPEFSEKIRYQNTGDTCLEALKEISLSHEIGFELFPILSVNPKESNLNILEFRVIKPVDRSIGNAEGNIPIVFGFEFDNLTNLQFEQDASVMHSVAIVAAEGTGKDRHVIEVGDKESIGIDRIELYVDARDLQPEEATESIKQNEELEEKMKQRGKEKLAEKARFVSFDGTINTNSMKYKYGVDFKLGDYVTIINQELNLKVKAQIVSATKSTSEGVEYLDLEFGYNRLALLK